MCMAHVGVYIGTLSLVQLSPPERDPWYKLPKNRAPWASVGCKRTAGGRQRTREYKTR
jgi:hypothetical protein